jgi:ABC-type phosphate transport system substrate-binding protein
VLLAAPYVASQEKDFSVVVARSSPLTSVKRQELAKVFLRKITRWSDGTEAIPVDQSLRVPVRAAFTKAVLSLEGISQISAVESYWLQQVYSGRGSAPVVKPSDAEVIAFVASKPGGVGYVSAQADVSSVKVLKID